ncbi:hypothetical protein Cni_G08602 [Canna indica]|uniref:Neprosin PEP catalytic domain-containing protein n=1 Tax=Canna indica TaxID=4628 RepID=A0AAQ3K6F4_9LILI|nr:hypothetical protein Cni_G08602 [Canna indica]
MALRGHCRPHLLLVLTLIIVGALAGLSNAARNTTSTMTSKELKMIRARLRSLNKPPLKSIQSPDGDIIDCIPFHLQPAFDHPMLKDLKPPLDPPEMPKGNESAVNMANEVVQLWTLSGETCPEGTVAIRRTKEEDILRAPSVERFGKKLAGNAGILDSPKSREHSIVYVKGEEYYGTRATINVWQPSVTPSDLFSLSQVWIMSSDYTNVIEAGYQVFPQLYGNNSPRLTIHWTSDDYTKTGCYNLLCPGFVQTSKKISIGTSFTGISSYNGKQYEMTLSIIKSKGDGIWWLMFGDERVGYWPTSIFTSLAGHAGEVQFGGLVVGNGDHTATQMGSGHFPSEGFRRAAYFRNLQVITTEPLPAYFKPADGIQVIVEKPNCYDIKANKGGTWENYFYYGGPGCH